MAGLAEKVSEFIAGSDFDRLPPDVVEAAKAAFLDCVGVALAGSDEESGRICGALAQQESRAAEATVIGQGFRTSATLGGACATAPRLTPWTTTTASSWGSPPQA